ncbi:DUF6197 family protein [Rhodococcus sp. MALMAid1271]|uniref:DUF6197 family protein n=1 Tax=Rhodococcus sp. MALMAid1271 TaxID=3411744 RepID=UPI003B9F2A78
MTLSEILNRAADLLADKGWNRGYYQSPEGCLCAVGAITLAAGGCFSYDEDGTPDDFQGPNDDSRGIYAAMEAVEQAVSGSVGVDAARDLVTWNDDPDRTQQEVIDTFRSVAKEYAR